MGRSGKLDILPLPGEKGRKSILKEDTVDTKKVLIMVRIGDVPKEIEEKWNHWYNSTHIPNRLDKPGFLSAHRYAAIWGEFKYLTFYDLASLDALTSEPYLKLRAWEASLAPDSFEAITLKLPNFSRGTYEQVFTYPGSGEYQSPDTEILFAVGHDVPSNREEEFNAWYNTEHIPAMVDRVPGFLTARRFKLTEAPLTPRSGLQSPSPKYVTLYDLANENVLQSEIFQKETNSPWSSWVRSWYSRRFRIQARLIYPKR
jgi:hypothetical protein